MFKIILFDFGFDLCVSVPVCLLCEWENAEAQKPKPICGSQQPTAADQQADQYLD